MSDSSSSRSPYEQGEVTSSPEVYRSRTKRNVIITSSGSKDKQGTGSPQPKDIVITKQVIAEDVIEIASDEGEIERDSLNIKPPQSQAGPQHREKSHKHKHKREKTKEKLKQAREKDRERDPSSLYSGYRNRNDRPELKDRGGRLVKDAREIVRERQKEKEKRLKESSRTDDYNREPRNPEKEARKRKQSEKERERLENMEREKQRERRLREERERADKQRRKEEERRMQQRAEAEQRQREKAYGAYRTDKNDDRERGNDKNGKDRGRMGKDQKKQRNDRERSDIREPREKSRKEEDEKSNRKGPQEQEEGSHEEDAHEVQSSDAEEKRPAKQEQMEEEELEEPPSPKANVRGQQSDDEDDELHKTPEPEDSSSSAEDSDSDSAKSSSSDTDADERKRPAKSKFENESEMEELEEEEEEEEEEDEDEDQHTKDKREYEGEGHNDFVDDTPPQSPVELAEHLPVYLPAIMGCRSVEEFHCLNRIEEGTFGVVYRARDKKTNEIVALKRLKMEKEKEGFPITSLREINTLLKSQHVNIVTVREIVVGSNMDKIYIVMDYVEHDLKSLMETMKSPFLVGEVKTLMKQLCRAVAHLHDNWILHRDLKTSNLLLSHKGILKVGDFGLAREYGSPLKQYTPIVVTLWYRAPELLLGTKEYSKPVDMWSVGCIFAELLIMKALWPGKSEIDQLQKIFKDLGTPNEKIWEGVGELPGFKKCTFPQHPYNTLRNRFGSELSNLGFDLLNRLLTYNPVLRMDASTSMEHQWYSESPLPVDPSMFPTWPARSEQIGRRHVSSPKPPSGGKAYAKLLDDDERLQAAGFHMDTAAKGASAQGAGFQLKF